MNACIAILADKNWVKRRPQDAALMSAFRPLFAQHELEGHPRNMQRVTVAGFNPNSVGKIEREVRKFQLRQNDGYGRILRKFSLTEQVLPYLLLIRLSQADCFVFLARCNPIADRRSPKYADTEIDKLVGVYVRIGRCRINEIVICGVNRVCTARQYLAGGTCPGLDSSGSAPNSHRFG